MVAKTTLWLPAIDDRHGTRKAQAGTRKQRTSRRVHTNRSKQDHTTVVTSWLVTGSAECFIRNNHISATTGTQCNAPRTRN